MKNYYKIIGVDEDASQEEIKHTYFLKVKKYHPDTYYGDKDFALKKTSELNEAYEVLKDEVKRAEYDKNFEAKKSSPFWNWLKFVKKNFDVWQDDMKPDSKPGKEKPKLSKEEQQLKNDKTKLTWLIIGTVIAILVILILLLL